MMLFYIQPSPKQGTTLDLIIHVHIYKRESTLDQNKPTKAYCIEDRSIDRQTAGTPSQVKTRESKRGKGT